VEKVGNNLRVPVSPSNLPSCSTKHQIRLGGIIITKAGHDLFYAPKAYYPIYDRDHKNQAANITILHLPGCTRQGNVYDSS